MKHTKTSVSSQQGNTFGYGASAQYTGRKVLDGASLDRFALIEVDYDKTIELACADGDELLVKFCNAVRKGCQKIGLEVIRFLSLYYPHQETSTDAFP